MLRYKWAGRTTTVRVHFYGEQKHLRKVLDRRYGASLDPVNWNSSLVRALCGRQGHQKNFHPAPALKSDPGYAGAKDPYWCVVLDKLFFFPRELDPN